MNFKIRCKDLPTSFIEVISKDWRYRKKFLKVHKKDDMYIKIVLKSLLAGRWTRDYENKILCQIQDKLLTILRLCSLKWI